MAKATRVGDHGTGVCNIHGAVSVTFTSTVGSLSEGGIGIMRVGDFGLASCGATTIATTGSTLVQTNGQGIHRIGDVGTIQIHGGSYTVTTGSSFVEVA